MIYVIIIIGVVVALFMFGVFDSDSDEDNEPRQERSSTNPWKYNKTTAQLYFDLYVSEQPFKGKYFVLKIAENNFAALEIMDSPPEIYSKNEIMLEMENKAYDFPEQNLSHELGICKVEGKKVKIVFADKDMYHEDLSIPPFQYMSFEGTLVNKSLVFDIKQKYYDQSLKSSKIVTLKQNVRFNQL